MRRERTGSIGPSRPGRRVPFKDNRVGPASLMDACVLDGSYFTLELTTSNGQLNVLGRDDDDRGNGRPIGTTKTNNCTR